MQAYYLSGDVSKKLEFYRVTKPATGRSPEREEVSPGIDLSDCTVRIRTQACGNAFRAAAVVTLMNGMGKRFARQILEVRRQVGDEHYRVVSTGGISSQDAGSDRKKAIQQMMAEVREDLVKWQEEIERHRSDTKFFQLVKETHDIVEELNA